MLYLTDIKNAVLLGSQTLPDYSVIRAEVPLVRMFGYSTELRSPTVGVSPSLTSGTASFSMEFACYRQAPAATK
jgi:elongation factor G